MRDDNDTHFVDLHVGKHLRMKRVLLGLSQNALAKELRITFQQVQKYETGANRISASRLYEASQMLREPVCYFFQGLAGQEHHNMSATDMSEYQIKDDIAIENNITRGEYLPIDR